MTIAILATSTSAISVQAAGRTSASIPNTILNGKGAPSNTLGINGDFYIDTRSLLIYGPKVKNKWPLPQNLQGPTGAAGASGTTGTDGKNGSDGKTTPASSTSGAQGTTGATGSTGATGATGSQGASGATGATGASGSGSPGATGAPGSNGSPGIAGAPGSAGAKGETGTAGSVGSKGETGTAGISEVKIVEIATFVINTSTPLGEINSASFGLLEANSSYYFQIFVTGESSNGSLDFAARLSSTGVSPTFNFVASKSRFTTNPLKNNVYGVSIFGTIKTIGATSNLIINLIDVTGESSTELGVSFNGRGYIQKVGTIL